MTTKNYLNGWEQQFTPEAAAFFDNNGYYVFPQSPFSDEAAKSFQNCIKNAYKTQKMFPNKVEFLLPQGPLQLVKPNVFEYDLHNKDAANDVPVMHDLFRTHMSGIATLMKSVVPTHGSNTTNSTSDAAAAAASSSSEGATTSVDPATVNNHCLSTMKTDPQQDMTLKLQVNTGGCFPWHYDNPSPPNKRLLTLAVYLTDPYDEETHGGQVQLLPFLGKPVTIAPKFNTVVLFRSDLMLHRVLPFKKQIPSNKKNSKEEDNFRCCFTVWLDGSNTNQPDDVNLKAKNLVESFIPQMIVTPVQRSLSRAVYDDVYQHALTDCFGAGTRECIISLRMHEAHVKQLVGNASVKAFVDVLKAKREF